MGTATSGGQDEGGEPQLQRGAEVSPHHGHRRLAEVDGATEVAAQDVPEEHAVLDGQRPVEAQVPPDAQDLARRRVGRQEERHRVAGEPHDHEHHGGHQPQRDQRAEDPVADEGEEPAHGEGPLTPGLSPSGEGRG